MTQPQPPRSSHEMGRESRQQRRSRERRQMARNKGKESTGPSRVTWQIVAVAAVIVVAAAVLFGRLAFASSGSSSLPKEAPGKTIDGITCQEEMFSYHVHEH